MADGTSVRQAAGVGGARAAFVRSSAMDDAAAAMHLGTELRPGRVLARSLAIWARHFVAFFVATFVIYLPASAGLVLLSSGVIDLSPAAAMMSEGLLGLLFGMLAAGAVAQAVFAQLEGEDLGIGWVLGRGLRRVPSQLGVVFLLTLLVGGIAALLFLVVGVLAAMLSLASRMLGIVAFVPLVVTPLVALMSIYWVAVPAAVAEHVSPVAALRRSARLTRGERLPIAALVLLVCGVGFGLDWLCTGASAQIIPPALLALRVFVTLAVSALAATVSAVTYNDLRQLRDNVSSAQLARAVD
jgi:hypothetical protein